MRRVIFFDVNGVLIKPRISFYEFIGKQLGKDPNILKKAFREKLNIARKRFIPFFSIWKSAIREAYRITIKEETIKGFYIEMIESFFSPNKDLLKVLPQLYKYNILGVISNGTYCIVKKELEKHDILRFFDNELLITSDIVKSYKPNKKIFEQALTLARTKTSGMIIFVSHSTKELIAAKNAGMRVILFNNSSQFIRELEAERYETG